MKKLLCILSLMMFSSFALGQVNLPPCDPNNTPPNCTDYFGVANWANSPLPAGAITGFTIKAAGSGYATPTVVITDPTGSGAGLPTFTLDATFGLATVSGGGGGSNYIAPQITIVDLGPGGTPTAPTCGAVGQVACGSGAIVLPTIGAPLTAGTGMRKFVDALPDLKTIIAVPDTTTFPGSDYYVIGLQEYSQKFHSDLPATKLRGYVQLNNPAGASPQSYLGPVILAAKNRPVRVLFKNMLPVGTGGNLFVPVDRTYMGAGMDMNAPGMASYTDNRATLHLHGGATPWISDGTPHQWTTPTNELGPARGDSVQFVPDMWFDATGSVIASCAGQGSCNVAGATNDPGQGNLTFFWTNQQGGRLMFYHDHAYGITRLNVYVGEAAGYLLGDPLEEDALQAATVPGTIAAAVGGTTSADLTHVIPLVIQDKTFVPSAAQLAVEDPTWVAGGFGTTPGATNPGDLWFPHVYTPNQNPADSGGANAFGRWDYGPWTLPGNQTALLAASPQDAITIPCTSSAFPNQAVSCPITPNPSGTPESFMDTPLVNGKAYPILHVAPAAYRFQILSAGNDRSLNLQWYLADPTVTTVDGRTSTEVKMVPSVQPSGATGTLPLCTAITPITNTSLFMGLATALLDATGSPLNGTGLPAGCWPSFGAQTAGIPVQQTMWPADGRAGGVPDPTTAGPPWIEIGTEGGLLPAPVVIPSMPIGYEANTRSVTITNVSVHGLWLGPAERADAIVDFTQFAGKTLILYNDAPTPAPAVDSRLDYFTDDGDQTPIGGAPNTLAGFGPNTRTIMQVIVDQTAPNTVPFNLPALQGALPGIFAQTQPAPIVPEPTYPPASGGYSPTLTYSLISDDTLTWFPIGSTTPVTYVDDRKTIQELFTLDYGRMNATLGVELPLTNFLTQTTIPLGYIDPITEVINKGATQLWHITHNGVDTHFIHFHLFNVQVINRSAWDGTKRPPDQNELGWKDTVRMNPLEDILVALQPIQPMPPFPLRDSYRLMDVTAPAASDCAAPTAGLASPLPCSIFTNVNPADNNPFNTPNEVRNFGWEYVWHCHILGHEENDMMRAIAFQVPPETPSNLTVTAAGTGLNLTFTDNSASETGFTLQRDVTAGFSNPTSLALGASTPLDANGQGTTWGSTITYNDTTATGTGPYFYRVQAFKPDATYWQTVNLPPVTSAWSNVASFGGTSVSVSPTALAFGAVAVNTTSPAQTVTLSNSGNVPVPYTTTIAGVDFIVASDPCAGTLPGNSSCTIGVTFTPTVNPPALETATLTINTPAPLAVSLSGTGGTLPLLTVTANNATMRYGSAVPSPTFNYSPANPVIVTAPACTTTATNTSPVGTYPITCSGAVGNYTFNYVAGTMSVTPAPLTIWASNGTMTYGAARPTITPSYVGLVAGDTLAVFNIAPNVAPTCTTTLPPSGTPAVGTYKSLCSGAVNPNYTISYAAGTVTVNKAALSIIATVSRPYGTANPLPIVPTTTGLVGTDTLASLGITVNCTTTATTTSPVGPYPITCTGPASTTNYTITYVPGTLTVTPVTLTVTANNASKVYGAPIPAFTATITGFVLGQTSAIVTGTPTLNTTAIATSSVGTYPITATQGTLAAPNYTFVFVNGTLTVAPATLTVTANNATKAYGAAVPLLTGTAPGLVPPDTLASIGVVCTTTATAASPVGAYPINCSGTPTNYTVSFVAGTLTVTPVPLTITANNATRAVNTPNPAFTVTGAVFVNGDSLASLSGALLCTTTATLTSPAGAYPITCSGLTSTNYNPITWVPGVLTVTTTVPVLTLAPTALTFASTANVTSAPQAITVSNTGGAALRITSINLGGASVARFTITHNCPIGGTGLAPAGSCTVNVTFTPNNNPATRTAIVRVNVVAPAVSGTVSLTGTTTLPTVSLSTTSINFGTVPNNTTSAPQPVTLTNTGTVPLIINSINLFGPNPQRFAQTSNCPIGGAGLAPGANCTINVTFHPLRTVARSATLTIRDNATGSPQTVALTGN